MHRLHLVFHLLNGTKTRVSFKGGTPVQQSRFLTFSLFITRMPLARVFKAIYQQYNIVVDLIHQHSLNYTNADLVILSFI